MIVSYDGKTILTEQQLAQYREQGYLVIPDLISAELLQQLKQEQERLFCCESTLSNYALTDFREVNGQMMPERIDSVITVSQVYKFAAYEPALLHCARALLGDEPKLFRDRIIFKAPGAEGYPVHQDAAWWQNQPVDDIVTLAVALDSCNEASGAIEFFPGYNFLLSEKNEFRHMNESESKKVDRTKGVMPSLKPGDVVAFSTYIPHQSSKNRTGETRAMISYIYNSSKHGDLYDDALKKYQQESEQGRNKMHTS